MLEIRNHVVSAYGFGNFKKWYHSLFNMSNCIYFKNNGTAYTIRYPKGIIVLNFK